jgi:hypothetical protein
MKHDNRAESASDLTPESFVGLRRQWIKELNNPFGAPMAYKPNTIAFMEETACNCGAGHGSGEGHTDWCVWPKIETFIKAAKIAGEMLKTASLGAVRLNGVLTKRNEIAAILDPPTSDD